MLIYLQLIYIVTNISKIFCVCLLEMVKINNYVQDSPDHTNIANIVPNNKYKLKYPSNSI